MKHIKAYLLGIWEFRSAFSTHFIWEYARSYDAGRELAHRLTCRRYEQ